MCIRSFIIWYFTDVCVWRLWLHYSGTRSALPSFERQPPFQSGTPQVLWQEAFQVLKCKLCQHAASGQFLKKQTKNEINKTKTKQETNPGILLNSAPRGHNIRHNIVWIRLWSFISKIWIFKFKMQWKTIADFFKTLMTNFVPLIIEEKNETLKFKKNYSILLNFTEINLH